jgi:hypothetical protein
MAIISQDSIKLGCSGGQGKIQIQPVLQLRLRRTSVENPRQRRVNLYKLVRLWRDQPFFMQNKANFRKSQMDIKSNMTRDYEKKLYWTLGENKPNQSQSQDRGSLPAVSVAGQRARRTNLTCTLIRVIGQINVKLTFLGFDVTLSPVRLRS